MNKLQIFKNEKFGELEIYVDENGKVWFPAIEVAKMLGYKNPRKAILDHCKKHGVKFRDVIANTGFGDSRQMKKYIDEGNVIRLITKSHMPKAEEIESWIFDDMVPSVMRYGMYATEELLNNPDLFIRVSAELKREQEEKKLLESKIEQDKPKLDFLNNIIESKGTFLTSEIAADYDISAIELNRLLHGARLIRHVGSQWILYKKHMGKEYADSETVPYWDKDTGEERIKIRTRWTQKGREKIHQILTGLGIGTVMNRS